MWSIIGVLCAGLLLGRVLCGLALLKHTGKAISLTIYLMLFVLGLSIGADDNIIGNFGEIGLLSLSFAVAGIAGSVILASLVYRFFYKGMNKEERSGDAQTRSGSALKGSLITVGVFLLGVLAGYFSIIDPEFLGQKASIIILHLLMLLVGVSIGRDPEIMAIARSIDFKILLLPLATIAGTLLFTAVVSIWTGKWSLADCLAVGSGFGYYSLSSVLISEYKVAGIGAAAAAELATIALLTNVFRELITLLGAPFLYKISPFAPIASAGVTSIDVALPVILKAGGNSLLPFSIIHGVIVDFSSPFFVILFCSL